MTLKERYLTNLKDEQPNSMLIAKYLFNPQFY